MCLVLFALVVDTASTILELNTSCFKTCMMKEKAHEPDCLFAKCSPLLPTVLAPEIGRGYGMTGWVCSDPAQGARSARTRVLAPRIGFHRPPSLPQLGCGSKGKD